MIQCKLQFNNGHLKFKKPLFVETKTDVNKVDINKVGVNKVDDNKVEETNINNYTKPVITECILDVSLKKINWKRVNRKTEYISEIKKKYMNNKKCCQFYDIFKEPLSAVLIERFKLTIPKYEVYYHRIAKELHLIKSNKFTKVFLQVRSILDLVEAEGIPYIIRGSAGCSLVCYLLNISNMNPIKENISLARFMHHQRKDMPDIDIDFPYNRRDEVYEMIFNKWQGKVARISNHILYKQKSAIKEAIRKKGYRKFIPKDFNLEDIFEKESDRQEILKCADELTGKFNHYSLHCGGIIIFDGAVPEEHYLQECKVNKFKDIEGPQIKLNKDEVEDFDLIKIDILSNRGLAQLWDVNKTPIYQYDTSDESVFKILQKGHNLGITFSESRAIRKAFMSVKPTTIQEIAICLAIIRPAASGNGQKQNFFKEYQTLKSDALKKKNNNFIIYDDDAIQYISKLINCSESDGDIYRKAFAKNKYQKKYEFRKLVFRENPHLDIEEVDTIMEQLESLQDYSFCKSHAISYAQLVFGLAYQKVYNPVKFWLSSLNHCNSSFRKWVHFREAKKAGIKLSIGKRPWILDDNNKLISLNERNNKLLEKKGVDISDPESISKKDSYFQYGYWCHDSFMDGMYYTDIGEDEKDPTKKRINFRAIIATFRVCKTDKKIKKLSRKNGDREGSRCKFVTFATLSYADGEYFDVVLWGCVSLGKVVCIEGSGTLEDANGVSWIRVNKWCPSSI